MIKDFLQYFDFFLFFKVREDARLRRVLFKDLAREIHSVTLQISQEAQVTVPIPAVHLICLTRTLENRYTEDELIMHTLEDATVCEDG